MADTKMMLESLQRIATQSNLVSGEAMKSIQTLASWLAHCLVKKLDAVERTQKQILDQVG